MKWHPIARIRQECRWWLLRRLPACEQLLPLMSERLDRKLTTRERLVLNLHLFVCKWCVDYGKQLILLRDAVRIEAGTLEMQETAPVEAGLSNEAKERLKRSFSQS